MIALLAALIAAAHPAPQRESIGIYRGWGAFRDAGPPRCYAIAVPATAGGAGRRRPFASVATWPGKRLRGSLHIRLSRDHDDATAVTLSIGERRSTMIADGIDVWAADTASDRAIVSAMRSGRSMSVEAIGTGGRPFADVYALTGAATAIDAAALACAGW